MTFFIFFVEKPQKSTIFIVINQKDGDMEMSLEQKKFYNQVKEVIKYNTNLMYFGNWTPRGLSECYHTCERVIFPIGTLSVDEICDAIWNEMSYNSLRFGTKSPFEFNGKNSIEQFVNTPIGADNKACEILSYINSCLTDFLRLAEEIDPSFKTTNKLKDNTVVITFSSNFNQNDGKPVPNNAYIMLADLRNCISKIASQNIRDFKKKSYQQHITNTVLARHANLKRPQKIPNFAKFQKAIDAQLQERTNYKSKLESAIWDKNQEILNTQSRIATLQEFENPGDITVENTRLENQNADLERLENQLQSVQAKIKELTQSQYIK